MNCRKCGTEFFEGTFCPECGTQNEVEANEKRTEAENIQKDSGKSNQELFVQANEKHIEQENLIRDEGEQEDCIQLKSTQDENVKIEILKQNLMKTKSQKQRKLILSEFEKVNTFETDEAKVRLDQLKAKIYLPEPIGKMFIDLYESTLIIAFGILLYWLAMEKETTKFIEYVLMWFVSGIPIWIIWKFILFIKSTSKNYYLNIKSI